MDQRGLHEAHEAKPTAGCKWGIIFRTNKMLRKPIKKRAAGGSGGGDAKRSQPRSVLQWRRRRGEEGSRAEASSGKEGVSGSAGLSTIRSIVELIVDGERQQWAAVARPAGGGGTRPLAAPAGGATLHGGGRHRRSGRRLRRRQGHHADRHDRRGPQRSAAAAPATPNIRRPHPLAGRRRVSHQLGATQRREASHLRQFFGHAGLAEGCTHSGHAQKRVRMCSTCTWVISQCYFINEFELSITKFLFL